MFMIIQGSAVLNRMCNICNYQFTKINLKLTQSVNTSFEGAVSSRSTGHGIGVLALGETR